MWRFTFAVVFKNIAPLEGARISYLSYHNSRPNPVHVLSLAKSAYGEEVENVYLVDASELNYNL